MLPKPSQCLGCPLWDYSKVGFVPATLPSAQPNGVLVVCEAPGEQEELRGKVLVGPAGQKFEELLKRGRLTREPFALHNVLSCRPPGNALRGAYYEFVAIDHCSQYLDETIKRTNPKVILAMGNIALRRLTGYEGILRYRGFVLDGPARPDGTKIPVVPTCHPSFLLPRRGEKSSSRFTPAVIRDIQLAVSIAQNGFQRVKTTYLEDPTPGQQDHYAEAYERALAADPTLGLGCDIETNYKLRAKDESTYKEIDPTIVRISFSFGAGNAVSVAWTAENMPFILRMLASPGRKYWWYGYTFDLPILRGAGIQVLGEQLDMLWAWHMLQPDLDRGLEPATSFWAPDILPWKHESMARPAFYSCVDADSLWRNAQGIEAALRRHNQWDLFLRHVVRLDPYLQRAGRNGIYIDRRKRRALYKKLRREEKRFTAMIQPLVPDEIRPLKHYKRFPLAHEGKRTILPVQVQSDKVKRCSACGALNVKAGEHTARKGGKKGIPLNACYKAPITLVSAPVTEFDVVMDFNPNSDLQLAKLVEHFGHLRDVKTFTDSGRPSLDSYELAKLDDKHPDFPQRFLLFEEEDRDPVYGGFYALMQELNDVRTAISRYVVGLRPNAQGVITTEITYVPATGRLSSRGLQQGTDKGTNLQNIPHKEDFRYADDIRETIVARPGYIYVEADSSSIEAVGTGHFMQDPDYTKIAMRGIHSFLCCKELGLEFTDENIKLIKKQHRVLYDRKKKSTYGVLYGMGPDYMHKLWPKAFPTRYAAQREIAMMYKMLPNLERWHHELRVQAHKDSYLATPWGYRRYFYDVFTYDRDREGNIQLKANGLPKIKLGEDGNAVVAQKPQNFAASFMRDNARVIGAVAEDKGWVLPGNYLVHDSYCLEVPDNPKQIQLAQNLLATVLTRPIPEMNWIRVGCEIKVGYDWGPGMKTTKVVKV